VTSSVRTARSLVVIFWLVGFVPINCFIIFQYHYLNTLFWNFLKSFWKFYHFEIFWKFRIFFKFWNFEIFLKILNFKKKLIWSFWNFMKFLIFFAIWKILWNFDHFRILPRVPDYCASLRSRIPPVTLYWFPIASFPEQGILSISAMDLESKYCYFYHSWDFVPY
jgi:hypothetical protein